MPRYIDADRFEVVTSQRHSEDFMDGMDYILDMIDKAPTEDVVPRAEVKEIVKFKDMAFAELKSLYIETTQEVAKGTVEIIQAHLNMLFEALQNEKIGATVEKLIEINSKIAILESIQLALGDVKKKYIGE